MDAIWEPFLTDQDRAHLAGSGWGKAEQFGFGTRPALLIIDDYYSVLGLDREPLMESVRKWPMSCGLAGWEAIDRTAVLLASARRNGIPVIHVKGLENFPSSGVGGVQTSRLPSEELTPEEVARGGQIVDELAPIDGELVIEKAAASAFHGTPLVFHLNALGVDTVIAVGETTSGCVRASVVDGRTFRYRMGVVPECCFDRTEAAHAINLFDMHTKYADLVDVEGADKYFEQVAADRALGAS
jgi:maleamate amidohydrolase